MQVNLQKTLYKKYPSIFRDKDKPMTETCMCWGIDTGNGWYTLIDNLCQELSILEKKYNILIIADQVKEKYGGLRFYYHTFTDTQNLTEKVWDLIDNVITKYEDMSEITCEVCGEPGIIRPGGWLSCLCDKHTEG